MATETKSTPLHTWHASQGANMADFGGYEMPLWYSSAKNEHLCVLTHAGLFDTSHMAVIDVAGSDAFDLLQYCFTKDLQACIGPQHKPLASGRCVYGAFLNRQGGVIDDAIIYKLAAERFMVVVNAGMGGEIAKHLETHRGQRQAKISDLSDQVGKIDIQGPLAAKILSGLLADPQAAFEKMVYFSFKGHFDPEGAGETRVMLTDGTPILLSRTGYTGEFGFEIFVAPQHLVSTWEQIYAAGRDKGLLPCGLAARDSLRGGAVLPLSHQDIGQWPFVRHPWEFALALDDSRTGFTKTFVGDQALLDADSADWTFAFVGKDLRKVSTADPAVVIDGNGDQIGIVLTCVSDMAIGKKGEQIFSIASADAPAGFAPRGLCCGFIKVQTQLQLGDSVTLQDKRRKLKVTIVDDIRPARTARNPMSKML